MHRNDIGTAGPTSPHPQIEAVRYLIVHRMCVHPRLKDTRRRAVDARSRDTRAEGGSPTSLFRAGRCPCRCPSTPRPRSVGPSSPSPPARAAAPVAKIRGGRRALAGPLSGAAAAAAVRSLRRRRSRRRGGAGRGLAGRARRGPLLPRRPLRSRRPAGARPRPRPTAPLVGWRRHPRTATAAASPPRSHEKGRQRRRRRRTRA